MAGADISWYGMESEELIHYDRMREARQRTGREEEAEPTAELGVSRGA